MVEYIIFEMKEEHKMNNNGNKDIVQFFVGLVMLCVGGYLFLQNVEVFSGNIFAFSINGHNLDGLVFFPLIASIIFLFFKYNIYSKICVGLSLLLIVANVIMNLSFYWTPMSLFGTVVMFVLLFGGIGLVLKTLFANPGGKHGKNYKD